MSRSASQYKSRLVSTIKPKQAGGKYQQGGIKRKDDKKPIK